MREWETMLVGTLVATTLLYLAYSCSSEYFGTYNSRSSTQAHFAQNDIPRVDESQTSRFLSSRVALEDEDLRATVQRGAHIPSQGVSTEKFTEFARIDAIDDLHVDEVTPSHRPETSDEELAAIVY
jgi:hypothetical protein